MTDCAGNFKSKSDGSHKPGNSRLVAKLRADVQELAKTGVQKARECIDVLKFSEGLIRRDIDLIRLQLEIKLKKLESRLQAELRNSVETETKRLDGFIEEVKALSERDITEDATDQIDELKAKSARMERKRLKFEANTNLESSLNQVTSFGRIVLQKVDESEVQTGTGSGPKTVNVVKKGGFTPNGSRRLSLDSGYCESQPSWRERAPGTNPRKQKHSPRASSVSNDRDIDAEIYALENALGMSDGTSSDPYKIPGQNLPITLDANSRLGKDQNTLTPGATVRQTTGTLTRSNGDIKHCNDRNGDPKASTTNDATDEYPRNRIDNSFGSIGPFGNSLKRSTRGLERVSAGPTENQLCYTETTVKQPNSGASDNITVPSNDITNDIQTDYKPRHIPIEGSDKGNVDGWSHADPFSILRALRQQTSRTEDTLKAVRHHPTPSADVVRGTLPFPHTKNDVKKRETDLRTDARDMAQKSAIRLANQTNNTGKTKCEAGSSDTSTHAQPMDAVKTRTESAEVPYLNINGYRDTGNDELIYVDKVTRANELWFGRDRRRGREYDAYKRRTRSLSPKTVRFRMEYLDEYSQDDEDESVGESNGNNQDPATNKSDDPETMHTNNETSLKVDDDGVIEEAYTVKDYTGDDVSGISKIGCNDTKAHREEEEEDDQRQEEEVYQEEHEEDGEYVYFKDSLVESQHQQEEEEEENGEGGKEEAEEIVNAGNNGHDDSNTYDQFVKASDDSDIEKREEVDDEHNEVIPEQTESGTGLISLENNLIIPNVHENQQILPSSHKARTVFNQNSCTQVDSSSGGLNMVFKTNPFSVKSKYDTDFNITGNSQIMNRFKESTCEALVPNRNTDLQNNTTNEQDTRVQRLKDRRRRNRSIGGLIDNELENIDTNTVPVVNDDLRNLRGNIENGVELAMQTVGAHHSLFDDKIKNQKHNQLRDKRSHGEFEHVEHKESACKTKSSGHQVTVQGLNSRNSNRRFDDRCKAMDSDLVEMVVHQGPLREGGTPIRTVSNRPRLVENSGTSRECATAIRTVSDRPRLMRHSGTSKEGASSVRALNDGQKLDARRRTSGEGGSSIRAVSDRPKLDERRDILWEGATAVRVISDRPRLVARRRRNKSIGGITDNEHAKIDSESLFHNHGGCFSAHRYSNITPAKSLIYEGTCPVDENDSNFMMRDGQRNADYHIRRKLHLDCSANIPNYITTSGRASILIAEDAAPTIKTLSKEHVACNRSKPGKQRTDKQKLPSYREMLFLDQ